MADDASAFLKSLNDRAALVGTVAAHYQRANSSDWLLAAFDANSGAFVFATKDSIRLRTAQGEFYQSSSIEQSLKKVDRKPGEKDPFSEGALDGFFPVVTARGLLGVAKAQSLKFEELPDGTKCISGRFHRGRWYLQPGMLDESLNPISDGVYCFDSKGFLVSELWGIPPARKLNIPSEAIGDGYRIIAGVEKRTGGFDLVSIDHGDSVSAVVFDPERLRAYILEHDVRPASRKNLIANTTPTEQAANQTADGKPPVARDGTIQVVPGANESVSKSQSRLLLVLGVIMVALGGFAIWRRGTK